MACSRPIAAKHMILRLGMSSDWNTSGSVGSCRPANVLGAKMPVELRAAAISMNVRRETGFLESMAVYNVTDILKG